jgi:hypothetical protein
MRTAMCALLLLAPSGLAAQSSSEPNLVFSFSLGLTSGRGLWSVPRQPLSVPGSADFDTVAVARVLRPALTATLSAALFQSPHFAWTAEIGYYGLGSEQRCVGPAVWAVDPDNTNEQVCTSAHGAHRATSVVGFQAGGLYRFSPASRVSPYVRGTAGLGLIGNSFVETTGCFQIDCSYPMLGADKEISTTWIATLSGGISLRVAPAYRLRMELRDVITSLPRVTGEAVFGAGTHVAPTARSVVHVPTFLFGLDLVFERRHTRRY